MSPSNLYKQTHYTSFTAPPKSMEGRGADATSTNKQTDRSGECWRGAGEGSEIWGLWCPGVGMVTVEGSKEGEAEGGRGRTRWGGRIKSLSAPHLYLPSLS